MAEPEVQGGIWAWVTRLVGRHPTLVGGCVVAGMLLGAVYSLTSTVTYTAESKLLVGTFEAPASAIPGYVLASETVAANYARLASSTQVIVDLSDKAGLPPDQVVSMVTVTAIPGSAILRVTATSTDADQARTVAEGMADALVSEVGRLNDGSSNVTLLDDYTKAQVALSDATKAQLAAVDKVAASPVSGGKATSWPPRTGTWLAARLDGQGH